MGNKQIFLVGDRFGYGIIRPSLEPFRSNTAAFGIVPGFGNQFGKIQRFTVSQVNRNETAASHTGTRPRLPVFQHDCIGKFVGMCIFAELASSAKAQNA